MKKSFYTLLVFVLSASMFFPAFVNAQEETETEETTKKKRTKYEKEGKLNWDKVLQDWNIGLHVGVTMPYTDVRSYDWFRKTKPVNEYQYTFGASLTKMFGGVFGVQARYNYGKLQGFSNFNSDFQEDVQFWEIVGIDKPFYFATNFHQPTLNVYINFSNMFLSLNRKIRAKTKEEPLKDRKISIYGRAGIGAIWFDSELRDLNTNNLIDGSQFGQGFSGSAVEVVYPFALGMKFKVSQFIDLNFEGEFTFVHDDKLDAFVIEDVTKDQFILDVLDGGDIPPERVRNSLGGRYDKHLNFTAGILFKFGNLKSQKEHIEWVNTMEAYSEDTDAKLKYLLDNMYVVKDADKDGVIDELDLEPDSAPDAFVDSHGVTMDSDKDGIPDSEDPEPFSSPLLAIEDGKNVYPETMTPNEIKEYVTTYVTTEIEDQAPKAAGWALSMIFFDLDKSNIKPSMVPELYKVAVVMQKYPDMMVNVKGHTDVRNKDDYNLNLSEERVAAAIDYLVTNYNISRSRFSPGFFGEKDNLIDDAKKESEHSLNRRVEFTPANY